MSSTDSRNVDNWKGKFLKDRRTIFDPTVKMMGQITGGIKVMPTNPAPQISDANALKKIIGGSKTLG